jgi:hypothetical protein
VQDTIRIVINARNVSRKQARFVKRKCQLVRVMNPRIGDKYASCISTRVRMLILDQDE